MKNQNNTLIKKIKKTKKNQKKNLAEILFKRNIAEEKKKES